MFPKRFFPNRYFAPRYFPKVGATIVLNVGSGRPVKANKRANITAEVRGVMKPAKRGKIENTENVNG